MVASAHNEHYEHQGENMNQSMSVVEARRSFSEVIARVAFGKQRIIVERKGKPLVAVIAFEDLHRLEALDRDASALDRRREALALADAARAKIRQERHGIPLPDSAEVIEQLRAGADEDAGLR
jgi:prevent-host-death family protein